MSKEHVIQRAKERLNLCLTEFDCDVLSQMIRDNDCEHLKKPWHAVKYKGRIFKVCYSGGAVSTVLPIT